MLTNPEEVMPLLRKAQEREHAIGMQTSVLCGRPETVFLAAEKPAVSMKTLYSDFVVRELSPFFHNGEPLVLEGKETCTITRANAERKRAREEDEAVGDAVDFDTAAKCDGERYHAQDEGAGLSHAVCQSFGSLVNEEDLAALLQGIEKGEAMITLKHVTEKQTRTAIHAAVKSLLGTTHVSGTENGCLFIKKANAADRREQNRRSNASRPKKFLHFTLYKENLDTNQVFRTLASQLHMSTRQFQFCGTKDKRAVTLQRVAVREMHPAKLAGINERSSLGQGVVRVSSFTEEDHGLKLGDAAGNHFRIVLRLHPATLAARTDSSVPYWSETQVHHITSVLASVGAVNYYGPQRFGTTEVMTSDVGLKLMQGDFRGAIELMFASRACFVDDIKAVLPLLKAQAYEAALDKVPFFCHQERDMLRHLIKNPHDYLGCLQTIPRTLAMLYFHAVQSLIWNRMATRRLCAEHGDGTVATRLRPEVGDLVLCNVYERRMELKDASAPLNAWASIRESEEESHEREAALPATRTLTEADHLDWFALSDVVLPVVGPDRDLQFPTAHGCGREDYVAETKRLGVFEALLAEEASSSKNALLKVFHYHGTYRPLVVLPQRVRLSLTTVPSWRAVVTPTDLEELKQREAAVPEASAPVFTEEATPPVQAMIAEFSLPPGSYATCVLREFTACVSENFHQKHLHPVGESSAEDTTELSHQSPELPCAAQE